MKKIYLSLIIIIQLCLNASDNNITVTNQASVSNNERGFAHYKEEPVVAPKVTTEPTKSPEVIGKEITNELTDIKKILLEQLNTQKKILELLKNEYDPEPKIIKNDKGEDCIENSSAECFKMPIIAEAKRIPVYKNWMEKGDIQSSYEKKRWEAKYFDEISRGAYSDVAAIMQFGPKAYPTNYNTMNYNNTTGQATVVKENLEKKVLADNFNKVNFIYFIGLNQDMDLYAMDNIVKFLNDYKGKIKLQFIFKDENSMKAFKIAQNHNTEFKVLNDFKMSVAPVEFSNFGIYDTPSLVAINKEKKTGQTILMGRASPSQTTKMVLMYMRSQNMINSVDLNTDAGWNGNSDYGKNYVKDYLGESFLKELEGKK